MELKIVSIREMTEPNPAGGWIRYKLAKFLVNGDPQTLKISMVDFDAEKARDLIEKEARKVDAIYIKRK